MIWAAVIVLASPGGDGGQLLRGGQTPSDSVVVAGAPADASPDVAVASSGSAPEEVEIVGDVIDCPPAGSGPEDAQFKFKSEGNEFEVIGLLVSLTAMEVRVAGPAGVPGGNPVTAAVDGSTEVKGSLVADDPVKVEGSVLGDGSFLAREIGSACEDDDDDGEGDDSDADNDDNADSDDNSGSSDSSGEGDHSGSGHGDDGED